MATNVIKYSFSAGEVSPTLYGRADLAKYQNGAAKAANFFVDYRGGLSSRPGSRFIGRARANAEVGRLIPFTFSTVQTYVLELGNLYFRVIRNGAYVTETPVTVTNITQANPAVLTTSGAHGMANGDDVFLTGGQSRLAGRFYRIRNVTATTMELEDINGSAVNSIGAGVFSGAATVARIYTVTTPWPLAALRRLKSTQSADVLTITHPDYDARDITRTGHAAWTLTTRTIGSSVTAPTGLAVTGTGTGTFYAVTVTALVDGEESVAAARVVAAASVGGRLSISWTAVAGATGYVVYKSTQGDAATVPVGTAMGYIANTTGTSFIDNNITPDFSRQAPQNTNPFTGNPPAASAYFQQRWVAGGSNNRPSTVFGSKPGAFRNFDVSSPINEGDSYSFTLSSQDVNAIKHFVPMPGGLLAFTTGGVWQLSGGGTNQALTATDVVANPQSYTGSSDVQPIITNYNVIYVQDTGSVVRELAYNLFTNIYSGTDITVYNNHLFQPEGTVVPLVSSANALEPFKLQLYVREDGQINALTYLKEQELTGWTPWTTQGKYIDVTSIKENGLDAVYSIVRRFIAGAWRTSIERFAERSFEYGAEDAWCVDCGLRNNLTPVNSVCNASASSGLVTLTTPTNIFFPSDLGKVVRFGRGIGTVTAFVSATEIKVTFVQPIADVIPITDVPYEQPANSWYMDAPFTTIFGLEHLEGQTVSVLADGSVAGFFTVNNGSITLQTPASKVCLGLQFICDGATLELDVGEPTIQGKRKKISAATVKLYASRGMELGSSINTLDPNKERDLVTAGRPIDLITGDIRMVLDPLWATQGQIFFRQREPLPLSVLAVVMEVEVGDR